jgi:dipeptidyl aminopeptidase/acylaminoacyl peptidase
MWCKKEWEKMLPFKCYRKLEGVIGILMISLAACGSPSRTISHQPQFAYSGDLNNKSAIHIMNVDGSGITALTNGASNDSDPLWSPDGKYFSLSSNLDKNYDAKNWKTWIVSLDSFSQVDVTKYAGSGPVAWRP